MRILIFALLTLVSGCSFALLGSNSSSVKDVIKLDSPHPEFMDIIADYGDLNDYDVHKYDNRSDVLDPSMAQQMSVVLSSGAGFGSAYLASLTGRLKASWVKISSSDNGKVWNCDIAVQGNFDAASEDAALKFWSDLKPKLLLYAKGKLGNFQPSVKAQEKNEQVTKTSKPENQPHIVTKPPILKKPYSEIINVP